MTPGLPQPPRLARWLLRRLLPPDAREWIVGDLDEEFARHRRPTGRARAALWYWSQACRSLAQTQTLSRTLEHPPTPAHTPESTMSATSVHHDSLSARLTRILAAVPSDVRLAARTLRRAPGYTAAALLTFGVGIGATIAIFSTVNEVLLRPLPYADPDRLAILWESNQERGWDRVEAAPANVEDWRAQAASFDDIAFVNPFSQTASLITAAGPMPAEVSQVSGNFFSVLGVPPAAGRVFRDDETFTPAVAILSHDTWRTHLAADPSVIGRTIELDGRRHDVVGVMGPGFRDPLGDPDVWVTLVDMAARRETIWWRQAHVVRPIGRLTAGVSFDQASAELAAISAALERQLPDTNAGMVGGVAPMQEFLASGQRTTLLLLLGAVGLLQLIACANVANLMLGRAAGRGRDLAVRAALGAERGRLTRQTLTESLVLAAGGTLLGLVVGYAGLQVMAALAPPDAAPLVFRIDWRIAAFAAGLCVTSALLAGALPAWRHGRIDAARHLTGDARSGTTGRRQLAAANGFVAFEIALAVLIVAAAGLMVRSLDQIRRIDSGIDAANVLTFQVRPTSGTYPTGADRARFGMALVDALDALPGVDVAGTGRGLPLTGYSWSSDFTIDRWDRDRFGIDVRHREATSGYFEALGVPLLAGRLFDSRDLAPDAPVPVVVNQAFVDRYFPDESPVGRRVAFDDVPTESSYWYPIVGVVGNERKALLTEPVPEIISHIRGNVPSTLTFVVKTSVPPLSLVPQVRGALDTLDRAAPLLEVRTMEAVIADARASERFLMTVFGLFAGAALLLAAVGVYGVANQAARARTREVGIRLALGASGRSVVRHLIARGTAFAALGLAAGVGAALAGGRMLGAWLYQVDPRDPLTLAAVVVVMALVALTATVWPTWRASRVDPARVLGSGLD